MLTFIFAYALISLICFFTGYCIDFYFWRALNNSHEYHYKPFILYLLTGLVSLTVVGEWMALFFPCNFWVTIVASFIIFLFILRKRRVHQPFLEYSYNRIRGLPLPYLFLISAVGLLIVLINTGPTLMDDTESYHIQMVKWIQEYGSPKGIANLHSRYGFNSAWFSSIALFSIPSTSLNTYTLLNGVLGFWFCSYLVSSCHTTHIESGKAGPRVSAASFFIILVICLLLWPIIRGSAGTSNYDLISSVIVFVLFATLMLKTKLTQDYYLQWIFLPLFIFTVRVMNYPFLLLTLFVLYMAYKQRKHKVILFTAIASIVIVTPFLVRNLFLSGYLVYPSLALDIFEVDWKVERQTPQNLLHFIKYFNRVNDMYLPISQTALYKFPDWIPLWYKYLFGYDKALVNLVAASMLISFFFIIPIKRLIIEVKIYIAVVILSLISWFFIAPDARFVYGSMLIMIFFFLWIAFRTYDRIPSLVLSLPVIVLGFIILSFGLLKAIADSNYRNLILPSPLKEPPVVSVIQYNILYHIPEKVAGNWNKRCYGTSLPCLYEINPKLMPRGNSIKDGFRVKESNY